MLRAGGALWLALACAPVTWAAEAPLQLWEEVYVRMREGATVQARFHLTVAAGYRLVAHAVPAGSGLQPLILQAPRVPGLRLGAPIYPAPNVTTGPRGRRAVPAHEGTLAVSLPITAYSGADRALRVVEGTLRYQVCDGERCLPAATLPVRIEVDLHGTP